jgi:hypothetical protein
LLVELLDLLIDFVDAVDVDLAVAWDGFEAAVSHGIFDMVLLKSKQLFKLIT